LVHRLKQLKNDIRANEVRENMKNDAKRGNRALTIINAITDNKVVISAENKGKIVTLVDEIHKLANDEVKKDID
jgi:hypothetical protein